MQRNWRSFMKWICRSFSPKAVHVGSFAAATQLCLIRVVLSVVAIDGVSACPFVKHGLHIKTNLPPTEMVIHSMVLGVFMPRKEQGRGHTGPASVYVVENSTVKAAFGPTPPGSNG